ncbi:sugar phosphate isomerase/epimerase family protein [Paenibacillus thermotolerans]|uniref:sugar phosphate isomerase/epimerase family protein n=1 Tax=Paenibacillus thermotolerans TaxID=3027807 RepID=UPI0023677624|nr:MULTISPECIES: sugar phosphate isomerase/epimerase family protein [unclassified Paenibacillus]
MVLLGWCKGIDEADLLHKYGFDYIEAPISALQVEDNKQLRMMISKYINSPIPVKALNLFFPRDMKVVGPDVDWRRVRNYNARVADALARIGAEIAVFGSGGSRKFPDGWGRARADEQMLILLRDIAGEFAGTGITLAIEPLNRKETNLINSVAEGVAFAKLINAEPIRVLADFYHMDEEQEDYQTLIEQKDWLAHIHIADTGRRSPGTGLYPYDTFVEKLKEAGYAGMISAECSVTEPDLELPASLAFMRRQFADLP